MGKETCLTPEQGVFQTSPSYVSQFCFRSLLWTAENAEMTLILARLCSVRMRNTSKNTGIRNIHTGVSFFCDLLKVSRLFVILIYRLKCSYSSWGKKLDQNFTQGLCWSICSKNISISSLPQAPLFLYSCRSTAPPACAGHAAEQWPGSLLELDSHRAGFS